MLKSPLLSRSDARNTGLSESFLHEAALYEGTAQITASLDVRNASGVVINEQSLCSAVQQLAFKHPILRAHFEYGSFPAYSLRLGLQHDHHPWPISIKSCKEHEVASKQKF